MPIPFMMSPDRGLETYIREPIDVRSHIPNPQTAQLAFEEAQAWFKATRIDANFDNIMPRSIEAERDTLRQYLGALGVHAPWYFNEIYAAADGMAPMDPECRLAVNVVARREEETVFNGLRYMLTDRQPGNHELTLVINDAHGGAQDATFEEAIRFRQTLPDPSKLNVVHVSFPKEFANIGMAKRAAQDITIMRSLRREKQAGLLYIASEDIDISGYDPQLFENFITYLDAHPEKSAVRARMERDTKILCQVPYAFLNYRFSTQLVTILHSPAFQPPHNPNYDFRTNRDVPEGSATAYVAADLALAGGFPIAPRAENLLLGEHLAALFSGGQLPRFDSIGRLYNQVQSSPRRTLAGYIRGVDPYKGANFNSTVLNSLITEPLHSLVQKAQKQPKEQSQQWLAENIQLGFEKLLKTAPSQEVAIQSLSRILTILGFDQSDYAIQNNRSNTQKLVVNIVRWERAEALAEKFKKRLEKEPQ